jgi:hypothetical protein
MRSSWNYSDLKVLMEAFTSPWLLLAHCSRMKCSSYKQMVHVSQTVSTGSHLHWSCVEVSLNACTIPAKQNLGCQEQGSVCQIIGPGFKSRADLFLKWWKSDSLFSRASGFLLHYITNILGLMMFQLMLNLWFNFNILKTTPIHLKLSCMLQDSMLNNSTPFLYRICHPYRGLARDVIHDVTDGRRHDDVIAWCHCKSSNWSVWKVHIFFFLLC